MHKVFLQLLNDYPKAVRALLGLAIAGTVALAIHKLNPGNQTAAKDANIKMPVLPEIKINKPKQPAPQPAPEAPATQIVILTPSNKVEIDCLQYGGGLGCFDDNYQPDTPEYYLEKPTPDKKPRNILYRFW